MIRKTQHPDESVGALGAVCPQHPLLEELRTVLSGARGGALCLLDAQGRMVACSPEAESMATTSGLAPSLEAGSGGGSEWQGWLDQRGGGRFWADVRTTALYDADGRLFGFLQVLQDRTKAREARDEDLAEVERVLASMHQGERLLARARRMARRGGWEWNARTRELHMSDELLDLLGLPAGQAMTMDDWFGLMHPEDVGAFRTMLEAALETGGAFRAFVRIRGSEGGERVLLCDGDAESENGNLEKGLFGTVLDITEQRLAQAASRKSERDLQAVRAQPEAILYADSRLRIVEANPAAERLFGFPLQEMVGRPAAELLGCQACELPDSGAPHALREFEFRCKNGGSFIGETMRIPVNDASGQALGTLWMISDVSAWRAARERLSDARRRLAASREAERGWLARQLHDGPVQDLLALSYQLAHAASDPSQEASDVAGMRQQVLEVVGRLRNLIGELRPPGLAEFGLEAALEGLVRRMEDSDAPTLPQFELDLGNPFELPESTAVCLFRTAQEALQNAIKHARARMVRVRMRQIGSQVQLTIRDDGCGFQVPDSFQELARERHFGLLGLVERAELARGTLVVRSAPEHGTEVCLSVPLTVEPDADE